MGPQRTADHRPGRSGYLEGAEKASKRQVTAALVRLPFASAQMVRCRPHQLQWCSVSYNGVVIRHACIAPWRQVGEQWRLQEKGEEDLWVERPCMVLQPEESKGCARMQPV